MAETPTPTLPASSGGTSPLITRTRPSVNVTAECESRGYWKLLSRIFPENEASLALCRALGFREVGVYRRHAKLRGEWRDTVIVELLIGDAAR